MLAAASPRPAVHPLSCDASAACRRARDVAVSSWSGPTDASSEASSGADDYDWRPFVSGRRIDYPRPPLMNLPAYVGMVLPSVEAERPDAAPAISRVIVQTWREEVRVVRATISLTRAARRTDYSCCDVQLALAQP